MQDRFKLKFWDNTDKELGEVINIDFDNVFVDFKTKNGITSTQLKCGELIQCTGLKDKNGKLIYEGDILFEDWKNEVYPNGKYWIVKWNNNQANFYIEIINASKNTIFNQWHLARHDLDYEVIGNIYMDSHLLDISNNLSKL